MGVRDRRRKPLITQREHVSRFEVAPTARDGTGSGYGDSVQFGRPVCGFALFGLLLASPVAAQEYGVHVDPNSPAGKEYAIPIDQARRQAEGTSSGDGSRGSSDSAPLFGVGISRRAGGNTGSAKSAAGAARSSRGGTQGARRSGRSRSPGKSQASRLTSAASTDAGGSATAQTAALVAAVLLAGGLIGLVLHRLTRGRPD